MVYVDCLCGHYCSKRLILHSLAKCFFATKMNKRYVPSFFTLDSLVGDPKLKILSLTAALSFFFLSYIIKNWELRSKQAGQEINNMRQFKTAKDYIFYDQHTATYNLSKVLLVIRSGTSFLSSFPCNTDHPTEGFSKA